MATKDPIAEDLKAARLKKEISVPQLSDILGIPAERIYKWEQGKGAPKYQDRAKVEKWIKIGSLEEVPAKPEKEPEVKIAGSSDLSLQAIHNLTESGKKLASAHEIMASAQQTMATNEARLISLLEKKSTVYGQKDIDVASPQVMSGLLVAMAKIASGTRWHSEDEALRELGRLLSPQVDGSNNRVGIQKRDGKHSTG